MKKRKRVPKLSTIDKILITVSRVALLIILALTIKWLIELFIL